ncbi:hypothetical protein GCM10011491_12890 [Brucella endophytica]|uniref:N-acetyltransferase domain-containing protein n=1 Tax=Brucella endophytica TaxID=1963359 RepID=A0A916S8B3_9HYPH|nr:GNAT family N-acetyltransferase [Brucella endophytica]GGA86671.1 hypothetical protein GCM10011491_12890 [Brucella endophytica]
MQITFRPFESDDLPEFRAWFADAELSRRLSFPDDEWFAYVTAGAAARCWVVLEAGRTIAQVQVDREDSVRGYLDFALRPDLRGRGTGAAVLSAFLSGPGRDYAALEAHIEPDNAASIACCRRCSFTILPEPDAEGFVQAIYCRPERT